MKTETVTYYRYSSTNQSEDSIEAQRRACEAYAAAHGLSIVAEYADEAISGRGSKTASRVQYQRMLKDADKGLFQTVLIHKYDRAARSLAEHVKLEGRLHNKGITLIAVAQDFGSSSEAKIMRALMWSLSEYYSENLSAETRKGHYEKAVKALHNGGRPAFGYNVVDQKYVINELEAGYVKKMFTAALNREGYKALVAEMDAAGIRGKLGRPIKYSQIYEILRNERYTGTYVYSPTKQVGRENRRKKPGAIRIEDALPAIIDKDTFLEVQRIMDERLQTGKRGGYMCSGLVYCECGAKMHVNKTKRPDSTYHYYLCSKECGAPGVRMEDVDKAAFDYLHDLLSPQNQKQITAALRKYQAEEKNTSEIFKEAVDAKIRAKEKEYTTLMSNMTKADLPAEVVADLGEKLAALKDEIAALQDVEPPQDFTTDQITAWLDTLRDTPTEKAVQLLIERIDIKNRTEINISSTLTSVLGKNGAADRT